MLILPDNLKWFAKQKVARQLASLILQSNTVLYRQWFRGADNDVADSLSRDSFFLTHSSHERFLRQTLPHQVPQHFSIQQVPKESSRSLHQHCCCCPSKQTPYL